MHRTEGSNNSAGLFTDGPPGTTVPAAWLNAVQEELLAVIAAGGMSPLTAQTDTRVQLLAAIRSLVHQEPWDYVVYDQTTFNALWERTGANAYKIKDDYRSVLIRIPEGGGGYACTGALSFLSGGDAYGVLSTNDCTYLKMENGTYLDVGASLTYLNCETDYAKFENVEIRGITTSAVDCEYSFYFDGTNHLTFDNCRVVSRKANDTAYAFYQSAENFTNKFTNCAVINFKLIPAVGNKYLHGFYSCCNLSGCTVYDLAGNASSSAFCFSACIGLSNCSVYDISSTFTQGVFCFNGCKGISGCAVYNVTVAGDCTGFFLCYGIAGGYVYDIESTGGISYGYSSCRAISGCYADKVDGNSGVSVVAGFYACHALSGCYANDIDNAGAGGANGFRGCKYGSSLYTGEAANASNNFIDTADAGGHIAVDYSCPDVWT